MLITTTLRRLIDHEPGDLKEPIDRENLLEREKKVSAKLAIDTTAQIFRYIEARHQDYFDPEPPRDNPCVLIYSYGDPISRQVGFRQLDLKTFKDDLRIKLRAWLYDVFNLIAGNYDVEDAVYLEFDMKIHIDNDGAWSIMIKDTETEEVDSKAWYVLSFVYEENLLGDDDTIEELKKYD